MHNTNKILSSRGWHVAQQVTLLPGIPASSILYGSNNLSPGCSSCSSSLLMCLGPCTHRRDPDGVLGSWLQPGQALAVVAIWGANQLSLCLSKKIKMYFKKNCPLESIEVPDRSVLSLRNKLVT